MTLRIDRSLLSEEEAFLLDDMRQRAATRRERNTIAKACINDTNRGTHGPATDGVRCKRCALVHKYGAAVARLLPEYKAARRPTLLTRAVNDNCDATINE